MNTNQVHTTGYWITLTNGGFAQSLLSPHVTVVPPSRMRIDSLAIKPFGAPPSTSLINLCDLMVLFYRTNGSNGAFNGPIVHWLKSISCVTTTFDVCVSLSAAAIVYNWETYAVSVSNNSKRQFPTEHLYTGLLWSMWVGRRRRAFV